MTMRIVLTGGGTAGSVSPLLAVIPLLKAGSHQLSWIGTRGGPEREMVERAGIPFEAIIAPKLRRYFSWRHFLIPIEWCVGLIQALRILRSRKPQVIVSAGGFVSVPVVWAGWLAWIPSIIHQQDVRPGLANRLMQPCARKITTAFQDSLVFFNPEKAEWIGNPVRDLRPTTESISLDQNFPTLLIFGGGTGAQAINNLVSSTLCERANVIHLTGRGKTAENIHHPRYHRFDFLGEEMKEALASAMIVVCRAGLGTISELASLKKPAVIIPMPQTHQEENARFLDRHHAAIVLDQTKLTKETFASTVLSLLSDRKHQQALAEAIGKLFLPHAAETFAEHIVVVATQGSS